MQMQRIDDAIGIAGTVGHPLPQSPHHLPVTETGHHGAALPETRRGGGRPAPPRPRRRLGWLLRRLVALSLVVLVLWWLAVPLFFPITSQAVVNARLVQVRAPIDGIAAEILRDLGDAVDVDQALLCLANSRADTRPTVALETRRTELLARHKCLAAELEEVVRAEAACRACAERFQRGRVALLRATVREITALSHVARYQHEGARKQLRRVETLASRSGAAAGDLETARENESVARKRTEHEEAALARTQTELTAAGEGIYLRDETPFFVSRAGELALKIPQLRASLAENTSLLKALERELRAEQQRFRHTAAATAAAPVGGIVWARHGNLGQAVKQNEVLYELADRRTIFVEALLHQRHLASVAVGGRATVLLTGGKTLLGRVRAVRTPGPADAEPSFALKLANRDLKQVRVIIELAADDADPRLIGRHAKVLFTAANPGTLERGVTWLFTRLGG